MKVSNGHYGYLISIAINNELKSFQKEEKNGLKRELSVGIFEDFFQIHIVYCGGDGDVQNAYNKASNEFEVMNNKMLFPSGTTTEILKKAKGGAEWEPLVDMIIRIPNGENFSD